MNLNGHRLLQQPHRAHHNLPSTAAGGGATSLGNQDVDSLADAIELALEHATFPLDKPTSEERTSFWAALEASLL